MTDYQKVMLHLRTRCYETRAEWNGDEPGEKEDRANAATELLEQLDAVDKLVKELDL